MEAFYYYIPFCSPCIVPVSELLPRPVARAHASTPENPRPSKGSKKPYTAVTALIERLTSEQYEENDVSGVPDLVEIIQIQGTGPSEAARAIRKKLKYGNVHRQLRALTILDGLIQNSGGSRFQRGLADEMLLERLRVAATDPLSDQEVKDKCKALFGQWSVSCKGVVGMERIASLYRELPQRKKPVQKQHSKVIRETEHPADEDTPGNDIFADGPSRTLTSSTSSTSRPVTLSTGLNLTTSSKKSKDKDKKGRGKPFSLEKEKSQLLQTIASSQVASTNLMNALKLINRESKRVSDDPEAVRRFETCKQLRRQILRYIQYVETDDFLGGLIHANDELVNALMTFEVLDKSVDDDSDSEYEGLELKARDDKDPPIESFSKLRVGSPPQPPRPNAASPPKPPRPRSIPMPPAAALRGKGRAVESESDESTEEDDDENDPFGDKNVVVTPGVEKRGMLWKR